MGMSNAERQRAFRARRAEKGQRSVTVLVHECQIAGLMLAARLLASDPDLDIGLLRNVKTGRYRKP